MKELRHIRHVCHNGDVVEFDVEYELDQKPSDSDSLLMGLVMYSCPIVLALIHYMS